MPCPRTLDAALDMKMHVHGKLLPWDISGVLFGRCSSAVQLAQAQLMSVQASFSADSHADAGRLDDYSF